MLQTWWSRCQLLQELGEILTLSQIRERWYFSFCLWVLRGLLADASSLPRKAKRILLSHLWLYCLSAVWNHRDRFCFRMLCSSCQKLCNTQYTLVSVLTQAPYIVQNKERLVVLQTNWEHTPFLHRRNSISKSCVCFCRLMNSFGMQILPSWLCGWKTWRWKAPAQTVMVRALWLLHLPADVASSGYSSVS